MRFCASGKVWSTPKRRSCFALCSRSSKRNSNSHQVEAEQIRIRESREQELALKLPGVHLIDIAMRELELKTAADGLRSATAAT